MTTIQTTNLGTKPYHRGLHEIGNGGYAWLQPDGGWGWSNAGLIIDGEASLLVDTLFDLKLTGEMLSAMSKACPQATIDYNYLVNTHANGDHCNGNELVPTQTIIASDATLEELAHENPQMMQDLIEAAPNMGELGEFFLHCFGQFEFSGINRALPNTTFTGAKDVLVGDKLVELRQVGPAHTHGDVLVHVPKDRTVFTGDILFIEGHPILWAGPVQNWIDACDYILNLDIETVVPGHGPITDKRGVRAVQYYLQYIREQAKARYDAGLSPLEAAQDIMFSDFDSWGDAERIVVNVSTLYKEFAQDEEPNDVVALFSLMAQLHNIG